MFIIRASQKIYFNKFSNKNIHYYIEEYYGNLDFYYFKDFFNYTNIKNQFDDVYENKSSKNENKTKLQRT